MSKPIELREADFRREVNKFTYPDAIKTEFFDYWSEPDRSANPKMRFEKEKTWDLSRRLARWMRNTETEIPKNVHPVSKSPVPVNDFDRLDAFISEIRKPGSNIPFENYGHWYEFMKANRLLRPMTQQDCDRLMEIYEGNKLKCRCAVVQMTLNGYVANEITIRDILKMRQRVTQ